MLRPRRFDWGNLRLRIVSGVVLAVVVVLCALRGGDIFLILVGAGAAELSIEWSFMVARQAPTRVAVTMTATLLAVAFLTWAGHIYSAVSVIVLGAAISALVSSPVTERQADAAYGVVYIGPACLTLIWLRDTPQGDGWTMMLLASTWAADICAFAVGNLLKGPKLWPRFSPNKTWSGFFGGLVGAAGAAVGVAALMMHLSLPGAAAIGFVGGLATMMGDLWESMLKRRFGVKDSGDLIPGHGGLLDRVDGLMFATIVFAGARLVVRLGWAH
ncbi:MAG TPA: phosphatidate cytidylyltransferase [Caulobacteraceae bacterium]|jgi:phosphatidate cytidylyltransferase